MLARGKGFISFDKLRELFNLPEDALIVRADMDADGLTLHIVSEEEVEGKLHKVDYSANVRRFTIKDMDYAVKKAVNDLRKQGVNHDS